MNRTLVSRWGGLCAMLLCGCQPVGESAIESGSLGAGIFAKVGDASLSAELLRSVAPDRVVSDSLLAMEARFVDPHGARSVERAILGRALLERIRQDFLEEQPPTPTDLEQQRQTNWLFYDRPRAVECVVVSVNVPELAPEEPYFEVAQRLHEAAMSEGRLEALNRAVEESQDDFEVDVRALPPLSADERVVPLEAKHQTLTGIPEPFFTEAARLTAPGDLSPLIPTPRGFSFLYATEIYPALRPEGAQVEQQLRREYAASEVDARSKAMIQERRKGVRQPTRHVGSLLELVWRRQ